MWIGDPTELEAHTCTSSSACPPKLLVLIASSAFKATGIYFAGGLDM
jgi:hypothetical protein